MVVKNELMPEKRFVLGHRHSLLVLCVNKLILTVFVVNLAKPNPMLDSVFEEQQVGDV
jgi:hypothetical protein